MLPVGSFARLFYKGFPVLYTALNPERLECHTPWHVPMETHVSVWLSKLTDAMVG
jgi:hypothetical protein